MENSKAKQVGNSNTSSTFTNDLFGPQGSSSRPASSSSSGIFGSVFGPASTGQPYNSATTDMGWSRTHDSEYKNSRGNNGVNKKERGPIISENEVAGNNEPCYFNSSIYYGGQQVYSPNTTTSTHHHHQFKRDEGKDDDSNGNNSNSASRGNWWKGSLYY